MTRIWPALTVLVLGPTLVPLTAYGQTTGSTSGTIRVSLVAIGNEDVNTKTPRPVNIDDCTEPTADLKFHLENVPSAKSTIDVYIGTDCAMQNRDTEDASCDFVRDFDIEDRQELDVPIDAALTGCPNGMKTLWFLAVDSTQSGEEVGANYASRDVHFDTSAPSAPSDVEGGAGEREIPVSWETDETEAQRFDVYIDDQATRGDDGAGADGGVSGDGKCSSTRLHAGTPADSISKRVHKKSIKEASANGIDLSSADISGDFAAVAVVVVDEAGNESVLSELACVEVVPTEGFWERYRTNGGDAVEGCECRAQPGRTRGGTGAMLVACGFVLALGRRRRRV